MLFPLSQKWRSIQICNVRLLEENWLSISTNPPWIIPAPPAWNLHDFTCAQDFLWGQQRLWIPLEWDNPLEGAKGQAGEQVGNPASELMWMSGMRSLIVLPLSLDWAPRISSRCLSALEVWRRRIHMYGGLCWGTSHRLTHLTNNSEVTEAEKLCNSFRITWLGMVETGIKLGPDLKACFPPPPGSHTDQRRLWRRSHPWLHHGGTWAGPGWTSCAMFSWPSSGWRLQAVELSAVPHPCTQERRFWYVTSHHGCLLWLSHQWP